MTDSPIVTVPSLRARKRRDGASPIVMVTAYDEPGARIVSDAGVDVLLVGDLTVDEADLVVPHPRMWERRFVLQPLADLAPDLVSEEMAIASGGGVVRVGNL